MTPKEAKAAGLVQATRYSFPGCTFQSSYGEIDHGEWCRRECERFRSFGRQAEVVQKDRCVAVFATPVPRVRKDKFGNWFEGGTADRGGTKI